MSWPQLWLPVAVTVFAWWFSTGLILILVRLPRRSHSALLAAFGGVSLIAAWGVMASARQQTPDSIYCGFVCTLLIWGWHEASFLMGKITGPRPQSCPKGASGLRRFGYATATLIYHEVALFCTLIALAALTWQAPNQISLWTFALLFAMRLSAKFNIFLGVPNMTEEFFPLHLEHLKSYLPKRAMNPLMPLSLLISLVLAIWLWYSLITTGKGAGETVGLAIVFTLTCLGILEHVFMITPLPDAALWRWAVPKASDVKFKAKILSTDTGSDLKKSENG